MNWRPTGVLKFAILASFNTEAQELQIYWYYVHLTYQAAPGTFKAGRQSALLSQIYNLPFPSPVREHFLYVWKSRELSHEVWNPLVIQPSWKRTWDPCLITSIPSNLATRKGPCSECLLALKLWNEQPRCSVGEYHGGKGGGCFFDMLTISNY